MSSGGQSEGLARRFRPLGAPGRGGAQRPKAPPPRDRRSCPAHQPKPATALTLSPPQSRLGGGEGVEGLYGSVTRAGMHRVLASLAQHTGLGRDSHVVDVGSGLGR